MIHIQRLRILMNRYENILKGAATWGSFFRQNPDVFAKMYLHIDLKIFQRLLLVMMFWSTTFVFIACRGLGKTYLSAIYCVTRAILYPGTRICIASGTRGQAALVLEKIIQELKPNSPELAAEIDEKNTKIGGQEPQIAFKNTSIIKVVTAGESARGNRCNVLLLDEYRLLTKDVIETILSKFLNYRRMPKYSKLSPEERKAEYNKEKWLTMYLSSAYFKDHWAYTKCIDTFNAMKTGKRQFICGFPYQLAIESGFLDVEKVEEEMLESNFSEIKWSINISVLLKLIEPIYPIGVPIFIGANRGI